MSRGRERLGFAIDRARWRQPPPDCVPRERKRRSDPVLHREHVAYYEAGRVLAAWLLDLPLDAVSLDAESDPEASPAGRATAPDRTLDADAMVTAALAGHASEDRHAWGGWDAGEFPDPDLDAVPLPPGFTARRSMAEREAAHRHCWNRAHSLVEVVDFWFAIETLAQRLLIERRLPAQLAIQTILAALAGDSEAHRSGPNGATVAGCAGGGRADTPA